VTPARKNEIKAPTLLASTVFEICNISPEILSFSGEGIALLPPASGLRPSCRYGAAKRGQSEPEQLGCMKARITYYFRLTRHSHHDACHTTTLMAHSQQVSNNSQ
jgi:hypothetical protein